MAKYFDLEEENIISGCLDGDRKFQEQLYRKYIDDMYRVCLTYESDRETVKDILQEAFVKVFRSIGSYDRKGSLKGWIRRIVVNTAIDQYRKKVKVEEFVDIDEIADDESEIMREPDTPQKEEIDIIAHVDRLPNGAKMVFNLFALEGYSHKEIAEKLGISEGTSKSQFSRARMLLQQWIEN